MNQEAVEVRRFYGEINCLDPVLYSDLVDNDDYSDIYKSACIHALKDTQHADTTILDHIKRYKQLKEEKGDQREINRLKTILNNTGVKEQVQTKFNVLARDIGSSSDMSEVCDLNGHCRRCCGESEPASIKDVVENSGRRVLEDLFYGEAVWNIDELLRRTNRVLQKKFDGRYVSKEFVKQFVKDQSVTQLFKPYKRDGLCDKNTRRLMTHHRVFKTGAYIQFDLACMQQYTGPKNLNMNYILVGVDVGSRRIYLRFLQNKTAEKVLNKVKEIIEESNEFHKSLRAAVREGGTFTDERLNTHLKTISEDDKQTLNEMDEINVRVIQSDNGSEFKNFLFSETFKGQDDGQGFERIKQIFSHPYKPTTQGNVERNIGSLKRKIYRFFYIHQTKSWLEMAKKYQENYNASPHRSLHGMSPNIQALMMAMPSWKGRVLKSEGGWYEELGPKEGAKYMKLNEPMRVRILVRRQIESGIKPDTKRPFWSERIFDVVGKTVPNLSRRVKYKVRVSLPNEKPERFQFYSGDEIQEVACVCEKPERFKLGDFQTKNRIDPLKPNEVQATERRQSPRRSDDKKEWPLDKDEPVLKYNSTNGKFLFNWEPSLVNRADFQNYKRTLKEMISKTEKHSDQMYTIHWKPSEHSWRDIMTRDLDKEEYYKNMFKQARVMTPIVDDADRLFETWVKGDIEGEVLKNSVASLKDFEKRKAFEMVINYKFPERFRMWKTKYKKRDGELFRYGDDDSLKEYRTPKVLEGLTIRDYFPFPSSIRGNEIEAIKAHLCAHCYNVAGMLFWNVAKQFIGVGDQRSNLKEPVKRVLQWLTKLKYYIYNRAHSTYKNAIDYKEGIQWFKIHDPRSRIEQYRIFNFKFGIPTRLHYFDTRGDEISDWPENDKITPMMQFRFLPTDVFRFMSDVGQYEEYIKENLGGTNHITGIIEAGLPRIVGKYQNHKRIYGKAHIKTYDWIKKDKSQEQLDDADNSHPCRYDCELISSPVRPPAVELPIEREPEERPRQATATRRQPRRSANAQQEMVEFFAEL